jgi:ribose 1,5-bisphosphokinase PhnN
VSFLGNGSVNTFPLLGRRFLIMQQLDYNNGRAVLSTWSVPRGYERDESVKRGLERKAKEYPLLEPLPGKV